MQNKPQPVPPPPAWTKQPAPPAKKPPAYTPFTPGNTLNALISNPADLLDCYAHYEQHCEVEKKPISLNGFLAYSLPKLGMTRRWWGRQSRGDKDASKVPGLRQAVEYVETRIAGRLDEDGLAGKVHPGMAAQTLKSMDDRDTLAAEREATNRAIEQEVPKEQVANIIHPNCSHDQLIAIERQGLKPILYTQQQLEAGMPHILPVGFEP